MDPINPYAPPGSDLGSGPARIHDAAEQNRARQGRRVWLVLYAANLVVPGLFASGSVVPVGWLGVVAAVVLLAGGGFALLRTYPGWTGAAVAGAVLMALSQIVPMLQIMAGAVGVGLMGGRGDGDMMKGDAQLTVGPAFGATIVTGALLLGMSLIVGRIIQAISRPRRSGRDPLSGRPIP